MQNIYSFVINVFFRNVFKWSLVLYSLCIRFIYDLLHVIQLHLHFTYSLQELPFMTLLLMTLFITAFMTQLLWHSLPLPSRPYFWWHSTTALHDPTSVTLCYWLLDPTSVTLSTTALHDPTSVTLVITAFMTLFLWHSLSLPIYTLLLWLFVTDF